jgi:hypothetical protein
MRKIAVLALLGLASLGMAQVQFDDITKRMASPAWGTAVVGSYGTFREPCNLVISNYNDWCKVWPYVAGPYYQHGMQVPPMINWGTEQLVVISLGNLGAQGYGIYIEDVRQFTSYSFDIRYVITQPSFQAGVSYSNFQFGYGNSPFVVLRVPRSYGLPNFYSRYYTPPSYVVKHGCGCGQCHNHGGQVWMVGSGGTLIPYTPPGQQQQQQQQGHGGRGGN